MSRAIKLQVAPGGEARMLHDDEVDLSRFGKILVTRASHVEWCSGGQWFVQSARTGKVLAQGFATRAEALEWEREYYSPTGAGWRELTEVA